MSETALERPTATGGEESPGRTFEVGEAPLERFTVVRLDAMRVRQKTDGMLLRIATRRPVPGFRKNSKTVPPQIRHEFERQARDEVIADLSKKPLAERCSEEKLDIMPSVRYLGEQPSGDGGVVEARFSLEVHPEVPDPDLAGRKLIKPVPRIPQGSADRMIEHLRLNLADWKAVDRKAREGDRVRYRHQGLRDDQEDPAVVLGNPSVPEAVSKAFDGAAAGDEVALEREPLKDGGDPIRVTTTVTAVEWAELPAADSDFARKVDPQFSSVEELRSLLTSRLESDTEEAALSRAHERMMHILDEATPEFDLPGNYVEGMVDSRISEIKKQHEERKAKVPEGLLNRDYIRHALRRQLRRSMIFNRYILSRGIKLSDEELEERIKEVAGSAEDPEKAEREIRADRDLLTKVAERPMLEKALAAFEELVDVEKVGMDLMELTEKERAGDPEAPMPSYVPPAREGP